MKTSHLALLLILVGFTGLAACSKKQSADHDHAGHNHGHVHTAPHGGTLVEIGEHQFNLELVHDAAAGKLTAYVLGGHAEDFVRIAQPSLEIVFTQPTPGRTLILTAVANAATGETLGNTSQFEGAADWLKTAPSLSGTVARIDIRGATFNQVAFSVDKPKAP